MGKIGKPIILNRNKKVAYSNNHNIIKIKNKANNQKKKKGGGSVIVGIYKNIKNVLTTSDIMLNSHRFFKCH